MSAADVVYNLREQGITLYLDGDALKYRAAPGLVTAAVKATVSEFRPGIIAHLRREAGLQEPTRPALEKGPTPALPAAPWHPATEPVHPAAHWRERGKLMPELLRPTLEAIARAWDATLQEPQRGQGVKREHLGRSLAREYARLVGWAEHEPAVVTAPWLAEQQARWAQASAAPDAPDLSSGWAEGDAALVAWGASLTPADLPPLPFALRPGVTVAGTQWLPRLQADIAAGPRGPRARHRALQQDLANLRAAIAAAASGVDKDEGGASERPTRGPDNVREITQPGLGKPKRRTASG